MACWSEPALIAVNGPTRRLETWNGPRVPSNVACSAFCCEFVLLLLLPAVVTHLNVPVDVSSVRLPGTYWLPAEFTCTLVNPVPCPDLSAIVPARAVLKSRLSDESPGVAAAVSSGCALVKRKT